MNKIAKTAIAAAALLFASAAIATPITSANDTALAKSTVITFSSAPQGNFTAYSVSGVTFKSSTSQGLTISSYGNLYGTSGLAMGNPSGQSFDVVFDNTVSAFGVVIGGVNKQWTFTAYGAGNNVLEALNFNDSCCNGNFHGIAANGIKRVTFTSNGDYAAFDNFTFASANGKVPEPGSVALLGLAFAGFAAARRKKAKRAA